MRSPTLVQQFLLNSMRSNASGASDAVAFDKRRWTSFLTWAFFLAEMVGRDAFLPAAAHAADGDADQNGHHPADTAPIANSLPNIDVSTATESPEPITYQHAATMPTYATDSPSSELAAAKVIPTADLGPELAMGGHGGGSGSGGGEFASSSSGQEPAGEQLGHALDSVLNVGHNGSLLDLGLHLDLGDTAHSLLGGIADTLGSLPLLGSALGDLGDDLAMTSRLLSPLEPVVSLIGIGGSNAQHPISGLGLPGQLHFSTGGNASEMGSHGNYTSYGIALSTAHDDLATSDASTHDATANLVALDHMGDDLHGLGLHSGSDALHLDQTILKTAADVLA